MNIAIWIVIGSSREGSVNPVQSFISRVDNDGGIFEDESSLSDIISELGSFYNLGSFLLTPNAYSASKLYALRPAMGEGDLTFSRSTIGTRKNETILESMGVNVPRLDYLNASSPSILLEPARTNILLKSANPSDATWTKVNVTPTLTTLSYLPRLTGANGVWVDGNYAYVAAYEGDALEIIDISDPDNPIHIGKLLNGQGGALLDAPVGVHVVGNYAFVTSNGSSAVEVIDITDKANPVHAGSISHGAGGAELTNPWNMDIVGDYLYVVSGGNALEIIDISTPATPTHVGKLLDGEGGALLDLPIGIKVVGNYAYITSYNDNALEIVDISDPELPVHAGSIVDGAGGAALNIAHGIWVVGNYAYVASRGSNALEIVDVTNKALPVHAAKIIDGEGGANLGGAENLVIVGNYAYIASYIGNALEIVDISNPLAPVHAGKLENGVNGAALDAANRVVISGDYAYVASFDSNALEIIDISNPLAPAHASKIYDPESPVSSLFETAVDNFHVMNQPLTKAASSLPYVYCLHVKAASRDWVCIQADDGTNGAGKFFDLANGVLGDDRSIGTGFSLVDSKILALGNGEYLCMLSVLSTTATDLNFRIILSTDGTTISYLGDVTKGIYFFSSKIIQSSAPLTDSNIIADAAPLARGVDAITALTSASSLIGQTEGTVFLWIRNTWADAVAKSISISDGTLNNRVAINFTTGNLINTLAVSGGVTQATISNAGFSNFTEYKIAITYQNNKAALFVNGTKIGEDLTVTVPTCSRIGFDSGAGSAPFYGNIEVLSLSKTALSDSDAQTLTTI